MFIGDREHTCVASESCRILPDTSLCTWGHNSVDLHKKNGLRDVKRADFIRNWRRPG